MSFNTSINSEIEIHNSFKLLFEILVVTDYSLSEQANKTSSAECLSCMRLLSSNHVSLLDSNT